MKKNLIFSLIAIFIILLAGCSGEIETKKNIPQLPSDVPIYPDAIAKSGSQFGSTTTVFYETNAEPKTILEWYTSNMPSVWQANDVDFLGSFSEGEIAQPSWQTTDFSPNPAELKGRKVIITLGKEGIQTSFGIMLIDNT